MGNQISRLGTKLGKAKEKKYLKSHRMYDETQILYELQCERDNVPFIHIHEHKEGYATLSVTFPHDMELDHQTKEHIANLAECIDIYPETSNYRPGMQLRVRSKDIRSFISIPTEKAVIFAEKLVDVLSQKGMFDV
jgi:hypothetical protein